MDCCSVVTRIRLGHLIESDDVWMLEFHETRTGVFEVLSSQVCAPAVGTMGVKPSHMYTTEI